MSTTDPIVIKKYANRRLYNTATSSYVTLETVAGLVREGVDFTVEDARSGEDITRQILTQIIVETENGGTSLLPVGFLRDLIRQYGGGGTSVLPSFLEQSMKAFTEAQEQWASSFAGVPAPASVNAMFKAAMERNLAMMGEAAKTLREVMPGGLGSSGGFDALWPKSTGEPAKPAPDGPTSGDIETLRAQMSAMQAQLDKIAGRES